MISEHSIYCVGCSTVVDKEKAEKIFRTGFYKVSMRLGICVECESKERQVNGAQVMNDMNPLEDAIGQSLGL